MLLLARLTGVALTISLIAKFMPLSPALAASWTVAKDGSGNFATITAAANSTGLQPGDTVTVKAGTYPERVVLHRDGNSASPITFRANTGDSVNTYGFTVYAHYNRIEGFRVDAGPVKACNRSAGDYGLAIYGNHVEAIGNIVSNAGFAGIRTYGESENCRVAGNTVTRNGNAGLEIAGANHLVAGNDISHTLCSPCGVGEANGVFVYGSGHTFSHNYIHDITFADNPGYSPHIDAFQTFNTLPGDPGYGAVHDTVFEKNHILLMTEALSSSTTVFGWMMEDSVYNLAFQNNLVEAWGGLNFYGASPANVRIYHNTFRSSLNFAASKWPRALIFTRGNNIAIRNNIFTDYSYAHVELAGLSNFSGGYNLFWNSDGSAPGLVGYTTASTDLYRVNPLFVSAADYHLRPDSPAANTGHTGTLVADDYDGELRPQSGGFDLGFDEQALAASPAPPESPLPLEGDLDSDQKVNLSDFLLVLERLDFLPLANEDLNGDGRVNSSDLAVIIANWLP